MPLSAPYPVNYEDIVVAAERLARVAHCTPVLTSRTINALTGAEVFFKAESFQRTGSFKFRGAYNALAQLPPSVRQQGVITYSSGNHGQAIAHAAELFACPATIVMPHNASEPKRRATAAYGAQIVPYDPATADRALLSGRLARSEGLTPIPPYDHPQVIAGQGTLAKELIEEVGSLDLLLVCCGGGGLLSGCALAAAQLSPECRVIGVEPEQADDATRSFRTRTLQVMENPETIADGARTPSLGKIAFVIVCDLVDDMTTVSEGAIARAMRLAWERLKIVVEPTGALAIAGLFEGGLAVAGKRVGVVISGGNVDVHRFRDIIDRHA